MRRGFGCLDASGYFIYAFFILFATTTTTAPFKPLDQRIGISDELIAVWDVETQMLFAAVISFCFDQEFLEKLRQNP
ncbi:MULTISPECIES: hypothetical protein [unclassified Bartonella]|uniref:hypothetical protein n=1 Tax=unclassified Bartonella TaxID=2645622 RepID=UPI0035D12B04